MAKEYRAVVGFVYPADPESLKKAKAGKMEEATWAEAKKGDKVVPFSDEILKSWLANDAVEPVGAEKKKGGDDE